MLTKPAKIPAIKIRQITMWLHMMSNVGYDFKQSAKILTCSSARIKIFDLTVVCSCDTDVPLENESKNGCCYACKNTKLKNLLPHNASLLIMTSVFMKAGTGQSCLLVFGQILGKSFIDTISLLKF